MTRRVTALLTSWLLLACSAAVTGAESAFPDIQRIRDSGILRVAIRAIDTPPLIMSDSDGAVTGSDADLARDIGKKMGVAVEFFRSAETYDGVVDVVARKEADLGVSFLSSDVRRAMRVLFSQPYLKQKRRIIYNRAAFARLQRDFEVESIVQLLRTNGAPTLTCAVLEGAIYGPLLRRDYPKIAVKSFASLAEVVAAVKEGRVLAGFHGELQIDYYMRQNPETAIYIGIEPEAHYPSDIRIAVRPDAPNLLRWVNVYLSNHVGELDASELLERYAAGDD